jgi:protein O-GlcNAc transferase
MSSIEKSFNAALTALQERRFVDAEQLFKRCIQTQPTHVAALNLLTVVLMSLERFAEAEQFISRAVGLNRKSDASFYNYGIILKRLSKPKQALEQFSNALQLNPRASETWNSRGTVFNDLQQFERAISDFERAISLNATYADASCNMGKSFNGLGRPDEALAAYDRALSLKSSFAEAWLGRGTVLTELGRHDEAFGAFGKALELKPDFIEVWLARGSALRELNRLDEALAAYGKALALKPDLAEALLGVGEVLTELRRHDEAFSAFDEALKLRPGLANAWLGRGNLFFDLRRFDEAAEAYGKALALSPDLPEAWLGRGNLFFELGNFDESFSAYSKSLSLKPDLPEAWLGRGNLFFELGRFDESLAAYARSLTLKPDLAEAWLGQGHVLAGAKRHDEAFAAFDKAVTLKPSLSYAEGGRFHSKMHLCDWSNFDAEREHLLASVKAGAVATSPFPLLGISSSPDAQLLCARSFSKAKFPPSDAPIWRGERYDHRLIRIAYLSADFCDHPTSYLLAGVFEQHDRERFETIAISFGPDRPSQMLSRLKGSFSRFIDVSGRSDDEAAKLLRELEVDIAVDLMGYTAGGRTTILAKRPCPIQVNYLGYPGTMGADYIDYLIADQTLIPESSRAQYAEKIVYLPNSYQANDSKRAIADRGFMREEMGLPPRGFVFCCFNDKYKITPDVFRCWMEILQQVDESVLWLLDGNAASVASLKQQGGVMGIRSERIIFSKRLPLSEHLARHALADLFLDTLPYNAHTTASDALWAGVPVLTRIGEAFAGRVAASLLTAVGLPELIVSTADAYKDRAVELATSPGKLAKIKHKLASNRRSVPLFDTRLFTRHIEAGYAAMYQRHREGLPLDHIFIPD